MQKTIGLFFSESYIDELYNSKKTETFFSFIPRSIKRIINAYIVSTIINFLINFIIISGNKIRKILIKNNNNKVIMKGEICKLSYKIEKSIYIFFIVNYIIMIFSWYYITCFNNVYSNTKIEWIKSSILIIIIMELMPFIYALLIALLRYISIHCKVEKLYQISAGLD